MPRWLSLLAILLVCAWSRPVAAAELPRSVGGGSSSKKNIGLGISVGVPDLINFQAQFLRVGWLRFGYGLGTQPVKKAVEKFARVKPESFVYSVNETYEVYPKVDFSLRAFNSFVRLFPGTQSFYLEAKGTTWKVEASVEAMVRNKQTRAVASAGSVSFRVLQPMLGGGVGYQAIWGSGFFLDTGLGASYLFVPAATYWFSGLLGAGLQSTVLSPEIHEQVRDAQDKVNKEIDKAVRTMRRVTTVVPNLYLTVGWAL